MIVDEFVTDGRFQFKIVAADDIDPCHDCALLRSSMCPEFARQFSCGENNIAFKFIHFVETL